MAESASDMSLAQATHSAVSDACERQHCQCTRRRCTPNCWRGRWSTRILKGLSKSAAQTPTPVAVTRVTSSASPRRVAACAREIFGPGLVKQNRRNIHQGTPAVYHRTPYSRQTTRARETTVTTRNLTPESLSGSSPRGLGRRHFRVGAPSYT